MVFNNDIRRLNPLNILNKLNLKPGQLDVLDGSPPCNSFSIAGKREKNWNQIKQYSNKKQRTDDLFFEYIRFLKIIKPKVFVAENVKGLTIGTSKGYLKLIFNELQKCGYTIKMKVLNAQNYSVPQSRERLIIIGTRNDLNVEPSFPLVHKKIIIVGDAFKNLKNDQEQHALLLKNTRSKKVYQILKLLTKNPKKVLNGSSAHYKKLWFNTNRLSYNYPACTITATAMCYHPTFDRLLTIPEVKRLSSFPDNFILEGSYLKQWHSLGMSVPPLMMKAIALNIKHKIFKRED